MMNVEELEKKISEEKAKLVKLEEAYEKEEDEGKINKLQYSVSRIEENIDKLIDRQQALLDREAKDEEKPDAKDKIAEEEDEDVCSECGGDLILIGKDEEGIDVYECISCGEMYLDG